MTVRSSWCRGWSGTCPAAPREPPGRWSWSSSVPTSTSRRLRRTRPPTSTSAQTTTHHGHRARTGSGYRATSPSEGARHRKYDPSRWERSPSGWATPRTPSCSSSRATTSGSRTRRNVAVYEALRDGIATSASLMVPCPWSRDAAARYRGEDVGVQLTLNARVRGVPVGPDHPLPEPARRRRRVPADGRGRLGTRRPRRGPAGVPGADRAGDHLGLRRQPRRRPSRDAGAAARLLRRLSRAVAGVRSPDASRRRRRRTHRRVPVPAARRRGRRGVPRPRRGVPARRPASRWNGCCSTSPPGVTEICTAPSGRQRRAARRVPRTGPAASRTTRTSPRPLPARPRRPCRRGPRRLARAARAATHRRRGDPAELVRTRSSYATRSRPSRKPAVAVASRRSSRLPGSPAVFILPCMNATVGSSSPRAIASASGVRERERHVGVVEQAERRRPAVDACSLISPSGPPVTAHSIFVAPTFGAALAHEVDPLLAQEPGHRAREPTARDPAAG